MRVLLTGHKGYIGSHLLELLKEEGHYVIGCDLGLFEDCNFDSLNVFPDEELKKDIRHITEKDLDGVEVIMHLAAISNDPMGELDQSLTFNINRDATIALAEKAKKAGVPRFLFAGSCSVYGKGNKLDLDESSELNPVSAYAISKVEAEVGLKKLSDNNFSVVILRNSTAYGYSKMLRLDLVVNNLLASAMVYNQIRIMSDGTPWRPLIHCRDIARAFIALSKAPIHLVHNMSINIGANSENYQVKQIAELIKHRIPNAEITYTGEVGNDPRNYKVNFDLLYKLLPDFKLEYNLEKGIDELYSAFNEKRFSKNDFESDRFIRIKRLKKIINTINKG